MEILRTERLIVRSWSMKDLSSAKKLWGDPKVMEFIDSRGGLDEKQVKEKLEREIQSQDTFNVQYWALVSKANEEIVGCCGLRPYSVDEGVYELGFHIASDYWRKGYATEAAQGVIDYAFNVLKVTKLFAGHNPENAVSKRVLERLGFRYIGDEYYEPTGLDHPSYELSRH